MDGAPFSISGGRFSSDIERYPRALVILSGAFRRPLFPTDCAFCNLWAGTRSRRISLRPREREGCQQGPLTSDFRHLTPVMQLGINARILSLVPRLRG